MAITKIIKVKVNTKACIKYITNPSKTDGQNLVTYEGCTKDSASSFFDLALRQCEKAGTSDKEIKAYHIIQSFAKDDNITPEKAHELGREYMQKMFDGKFAFVCSTHVDKGHIHNHFVVCAADRAMRGDRLYDNLSLLHKMQKTNDELCRAHGLSVIEKKKGKGKSYKEWLEEKENSAGSKKQQLRKIIDKTVMESTDFDDFINRIKEQNIEIDFGNSKKYGTVTKYKLPDEKRFHRGYSLGTFYSDTNIKKRIERHVNYLASQELKKEARKAAAKARKDAMTPAEMKLDKSKVKIKSIRETDSSSITKDTIGLTRWTNKQNAMRMQQIIEEVHSKYGIAYTDIKGHISSLRADNNRLSSDIAKSKKEAEELRQFIENCVAYKRYKIYSINEEKAKDKEKYYEEHDTQLDAFHDAIFALDQRNIDVNTITAESIKILQQRLKDTEESIEKQEDIIRQNERDQKELSDYQKEIDTYFSISKTEI